MAVYLTASRQGTVKMCETCCQIYRTDQGFDHKEIPNAREKQCGMCERPHQRKCLFEVPPTPLCAEHANAHASHSAFIFDSSKLPEINTVEDRNEFVARFSSVATVLQELKNQVTDAREFRQSLSQEIDCVIEFIQKKKCELLNSIDQKISWIEGELRKIKKLKWKLHPIPYNNVELVATSVGQQQYAKMLLVFSYWKQVEDSVIPAFERSCGFQINTDLFAASELVGSCSELSALPNSVFGHYLPTILQNSVKKWYISFPSVLAVETFKSMEKISISSRFCIDSFCDFLITGGDSTKQALKLYSNSLTISQFPDMIARRGNHGMVFLQETLYVFGGFDGSELANCEKMTLAGLTWTDISKMRRARAGFTPCVHFTSIYIIGGVHRNDAELFDTISEKFKSMRWELPDALPTIAIAINDCVYAFQGRNLYKFESKDRRPQLLGACPDLVYRSRIAPVRNRQSWYFFASQEGKEVLLQFHQRTERLTVVN